MARGANSLIASVDLSGIESLFDDIGDAAEEAARPAAQAAAQVFYDAAKANVAKIKKVSGNLDKALYQAFSPENSGQGFAQYHISWNATTAPHGHLLEHGHWQRYQVVMTRKGWVTLARPENAGKRKPRRRASQAEKDAFYMPRPGGPVYIPGKAFMRGALRAEPAAVLASADVLWQALEKVK
ncbi:HK97 gp10 family phage protein [Comamonas terrigena]|uniref:HK97 gp10 family phage protein n=1 Tax=Comamonas terrigena TaxID=32013 RepID=UPI0028989D72|nr:HK97 gp10 family phage protein [Comamonas terrigena]